MTRLQMDYQIHKEQQRHNRATEAEQYRSNTADERENYRSNVARETETNRHNFAVEEETKRSNLTDEQERNRHNRVSEVNEHIKAVGTFLRGASTIPDAAAKTINMFGTGGTATGSAANPLPHNTNRF